MKNAQSKFAQILGTVYQSRHRILLTGECWTALDCAGISHMLVARSTLQ